MHTWGAIIDQVAAQEAEDVVKHTATSACSALLPRAMAIDADMR